MKEVWIVFQNDMIVLVTTSSKLANSRIDDLKLKLRDEYPFPVRIFKELHSIVEDK